MILVNDPGSWEHIYHPLEHAEWNGWTPTDLIFPFFLFIAGVSMTLSFASRASRGSKRTSLAWHIVRRSALIFLIGLFLNGFPSFDFHTIRVMGVLQRIALCYLAGGLLYLFTSREESATQGDARGRGNIAVNKRQCATDVGIAQSLEPSLITITERRNVLADCFHQ